MTESSHPTPEERFESWFADAYPLYKADRDTTHKHAMKRAFLAGFVLNNAGSGLGAATEPSRRADARTAPTAEAVSSHLSEKSANQPSDGPGLLATKADMECTGPNSSAFDCPLHDPRKLATPSARAPHERTTFDDWWNKTGADDFGLEGFYAAREAWQFALKEGVARTATEPKVPREEAMHLVTRLRKYIPVEGQEGLRVRDMLMNEAAQMLEDVYAR